MNVGNGGVGIWNIMADGGNDVVCIGNATMNVGNNSVGTPNVMTNIGIGWVSVDPKFGLEEES
jgi:hypothetical protein